MVGEKHPKILSTVFQERELCVLCCAGEMVWGEGLSREREGRGALCGERDSRDGEVGARGVGTASEQLCLRLI